MRIATYNLWNSDTEMPERTQAIFEQIKSVDADILCLQEVRDQDYFQSILEESGYPHSCFLNHTYEQEGLAILSKHPIKVHHYITRAFFSLIEVNERRIAVVNLHLDCESILKKEKQIIEIVKYMQYMNAEYVVLAGDFNCSPESSVHRFLLGQQSLLNVQAEPCWYDLAESWADITGTAPAKTIDFRSNPRWGGKNTIESNQRFDRILLLNPHPLEFPTLTGCEIFGQKTDNDAEYAPSDHWGVYVDLDFE